MARGLSSSFINLLLKGKLKGFWSEVCKDNALDPQIREDQITIYYRGGNLCQVNHHCGQYTIGNFHPEYANNPGHPKHKEFIKDIHRWNVNDWIMNIPTMKAIMKEHMDNHGNPRHEDNYSQKVVWENNRSENSKYSDYFIMDTKVEIETRKTCFPDIVAVKWPKVEHNNAHDLKVAFIEVKYDNGSLAGNAGIQAHIDDWCHFLQNPAKWQKLQDEMKNLFSQKIALGLMPTAPSEIHSLSTNLPELQLLVAHIDYSDRKLLNALSTVIHSESYQILQSWGCDIKIAVVPHDEYELYENRFIPIKQYIEQHSTIPITENCAVSKTKTPYKNTVKGTNLSKFNEWANRTELDPNVNKMLTMLFAFADEHGLTTNFPDGFSLKTKNDLPLIWDYKGDTKGARKLIPQLSRLSNKLKKVKPSIDPNIVCNEFRHAVETWHINKHSTEKQMERIVEIIKRLDIRIQEVYYS